jgi:hypothetical protein
VQPLLQWTRNRYYIFGMCICSLRYPACDAHALYCQRSPARLYSIFPHYLINDTIFRGGKKKVIEHKICVLIVSTTLSETFLILRRNERDMIKNMHCNSCKESVIIARF